MTILRLFLLAVALTLPVTIRADVRPPDTVVVPSGQLKLKALLWKPEGQGPFPALLFNHGSWPVDSGSGRPAKEIFVQAAALGPVFARRGFVFLFTFRRGAGLSADQGVSAADLMQTEFAEKGQKARDRMQMTLLETSELSDAVAGLAYLRALPDVDARHIAAAGHSFGGSLTLLVAQRDSRLMAAIDFAGAAASWEKSPQLRARLLAAVGAVIMPILFVHSENDYSVAPGKALAAEMTRLGKPNRILIYPPFGTTKSDGHNLVDLSVPTWEDDVFAFLSEQLHR
jgi:carboxymethylenebutenolidase